MNTKHLLPITLLLLILPTFIILNAHAHPGGTDSNGGHIDHSTGDYHYHHGYEAHDHYDVDGDGDIDCPFNFDDQSGKLSGSPSGSSVGPRTTSPPQESINESINTSGQNNTTQRNSKNRFSSSEYWSFCFMAPFLIVPLFNLGFYLESKSRKTLAYSLGIIGGIIWLITFPVSTFLVLGYFYLSSKK